jgi:transcriptional regulator with XRE-family HTH domain
MARVNPFLSWRQRHGLTQAQAAERIGVSQASYSRYERDVEKPEIGKVATIQKVTGIPKRRIRPDIWKD